jgi:hypothetical protein
MLITLDFELSSPAAIPSKIEWTTKTKLNINAGI